MCIRAGKANGMGRLYSSDGTLVFEGEFVDDVPLIEEFIEEAIGIENNDDLEDSLFANHTATEVTQVAEVVSLNDEAGV